MESITDLLGNRRTVLPKGRVLDERAELIKFFAQNVGRPAKQVGVRLGHYKLSELYALKSSYNDRLRRNGRDAAAKYYWWVTKTTKT